MRHRTIVLIATFLICSVAVCYVLAVKRHRFRTAEVNNVEDLAREMMTAYLAGQTDTSFLVFSRQDPTAIRAVFGQALGQDKLEFSDYGLPLGLGWDQWTIRLRAGWELIYDEMAEPYVFYVLGPGSDGRGLPRTRVFPREAESKG